MSHSDLLWSPRSFETVAMRFSPIATRGLLAFSVGLLLASAPKPVHASAKLSSRPQSLWYGLVEVGTAKSTSLTIVNSGTTRFTVSKVSKSKAQFIPSGFNLPFTLAVGQSKTLKVAFKPSAKGEVDGTLTFSGTTAGLTIRVHGTGVTGYLRANPSSISFGTVQLGFQKNASITVTNNVSHEVGISHIYIWGTGFSYSGLTAPMYLKPGQSYTFTATFRPKSASSVKGMMSIASNAPNWNVPVALYGTGGSAGKLSLGASTLNFGNVTVGTGKTIGGSLAASGTSVTVSSATTSSSEFTVTGLRFPFTIPAGQRVSFSAKFTPQSSGTASAKISFKSNASNSPTVENVTGSGISASQHRVTLSWKASTSLVAGYNIYRSGASGGPYTKINSVLQPSTSYTDASVQSGRTYYYVTTGVTSGGKQSGFSNQVRAVIP
jgi:hypothetical protein